MERARPGERVGRAVVRDAHVPHLRMDQAVHHPSVHEPTAADPGAHGEIDEVVEPLRRAPSALAQGGGVDVGVEAHRDAEGLTDGPDDVGAAPTRPSAST